ncbi:hypothetical protein ACIGXM_28125 [Kitasatospora sp. NPDC052896]|uniref:hypothetical protein n=1 Tax=Kitasatospora sp. NPDC052896 TaxID=3364061 RepID=UPI0037CAF574
MHRPLRRALPALAVAGIALATSLVTAGTAQAHVAGGGCDSLGIRYSVDGGQTWTSSDVMAQPYPSLVVKLVGQAQDGCDYNVSLASYSTQGATWAKSGVQTFLGWATATLNKKHPQATLDISKFIPPCFGQTDLYNGKTEFDGVHGPLPLFPNQPYPTGLISHWNGGQKCDTPPVSPPPTGTGSASPSPSTSTTPPTGTGSASPSPSTSTGTGTPSPSSSSPAAAVPTTPTDTSGPTGTPSVAPVSTTPASSGSSLAFTGTDGTALTEVGAGGAALLALGAGAVVASRRRANRG